MKKASLKQSIIINEARRSLVSRIQCPVVMLWTQRLSFLSISVTAFDRRPVCISWRDGFKGILWICTETDADFRRGLQVSGRRSLE